MKKLTTSLFLVLTTVFNMFADYSKYGRPWDYEEDSGDGASSWFMIIFVVVGIIGWNIFKSDDKDKEHRGPLGCIVFVVITSIIIYLINH